MRKKILAPLLFALGCSVFAGCSVSAEPDAMLAQIKTNLASRYPQVNVVDVSPAPLPGLYEIFTGDGIAYATANGDYLIAGPIVDTRSHRNLTSDRLDERNAIDFSTLPLDLAIKYVKGDGSRVMAVFGDPDCPFCQELEKELASVDNVTVYTFLYPLTDLHPDAENKARTIWCAPDRAQAWTEWMRSGTKPADGGPCKDNPVARLHDLGRELRIGSTPTLFFSTGRRLAGAPPKAELEQRLTQETNKLKASGASAKQAAPGKPAAIAARQP